MKKNLLVVLIVVLTIALFTACKKVGDDVTPTEKPAATENATAEPEVTAEPTPSPVPGPVTYIEDDFSEDVADEAPFLEGWVFTDVANEGKSKVKVDGENNYFNMAGFINMISEQLIEEAYTFSFDAKGIYSGEAAAAFVRGYSQLTLPVETNPNGALYYEADGTTTKFTSTTGIGLWFKAEGSLTLFVKTDDDTATWGIGNISAELPCTYAAANWNNIKIVDDNKGKIVYYVNEAVIATVEYSGLAESETFPGEKFYKNVSIKDPEGNVIASTENAFVYEFSEIAFGMRAAQLNVDNLLLKSLEEAAE